MRVACRGRGHSSWINCVSFDPWAKMSNINFFANLNEESDDDESDLEEYHTKQQEIEKHLEKLELEKKTKITAPKKRTISTLSDFNSHTFTHNASTVFYRLASVGQDNQICFWDLTEDVLKEKPNNRSRITSIIQQSQYQQQVQPMSSLNIDAGGSIKDKSSSIVLTARNLFSSKSAGIEKANENDAEQMGTPKSSTLTGSFFRRHKRNSSLNSNSSQILVSEAKTKNSKNTPIILNSYKKSTNLFTNLTPVENSNQSPFTSNLDSSANSATKKSPIVNSNCPFNLCPKLDEVPLIEPLICKRISNERLTSIVFKKDCFLVASQDGFVNTWARPRRNVNSKRFPKDASSTCL